jgi:CheY-like chemotaxis protein
LTKHRRHFIYSPISEIFILMNARGDVMRRILVIDDEKGILDVVRSVLSRAGFKVEIALNGRNGIQKFDSGCFDVVITDILMPEVDGIDVVKHIRNSCRPYTPIIGCSGTPWLLGEGEFDTVFLKPFPLADLVHAVQHLSRPTGSN